MVRADAGRSAAARDSLLGAGAKRGMTMALPSVAALAKSSINGVELTAVPPSTWASRAAEPGGEVALLGRLVWDDHELGWATDWQMEWQGPAPPRQLRGVFLRHSLPPPPRPRPPTF